MDELRLLITLRNVLRRWATKFHDLIEANEAAIEPDAVGTVRDLIEASMSTIDEMPIDTPGGNDAPSGLTNRIKCLEMISPPQCRHDRAESNINRRALPANGRAGLRPRNARPLAANGKFLAGAMPSRWAWRGGHTSRGTVPVSARRNYFPFTSFPPSPCGLRRASGASR